MVGVAQEVSHAAPFDLGIRCTAFDFLQPYYCLSEDLYFSLDSGFGLFVLRVPCEVHFPDESINLIDAIEDVAKMPFGIAKRQ
jgi:hypothetical protein